MEEIAALKTWIQALDKAVAEGTAQRKAENAEYKGLTMNNSNAKEVLLQNLGTSVKNCKQRIRIDERAN